MAGRWREMARGLPAEALLVANGDDPQLGELAADRPGSVVFGLDDPRHAAPELQHAADSKWCVRCGTPYEYAAAYVGHLGDYRCPRCGHARPPLDIVGARDRAETGSRASPSTLVTPEGAPRVALRRAGPLQRLQRAGRGLARRALGASLDEIAAGLQGFSAAFGRFERIQLDDRSLLTLLIKNPAGANEVVRTLVAGGRPDTALIALNDEIADGRDVSWIWDVDFEPLLGGPGAAGRDRRARGRAGAALQVRRAAGARSRSCRRWRRRSTAGSS